MDTKKDYQKACLGICKKRVEATIEGLGIEVGPNDYFDYYYGLIDFEFFARKNIGEDAVTWMKENIHPLDIVFRLAQDHGIVLLNGSGFAAPDWSVRISFANLNDHVYDDIGRALRAIARGYREQYEKATGKTGKPDGRRGTGQRRRNGRGGARRRHRRRREDPATWPRPPAASTTPNRVRPGQPRCNQCQPRLLHECPAERASHPPGTGDLSDAGRRVRDRPDPDRVVQTRERRGHAHRGRAHRTTRHQGRSHGQGGLLLALPVCHRLQGRAAVLSRPEEECAAPGRADGRVLRDEPGDDDRGGASCSATTPGRPPA